MSSMIHLTSIWILKLKFNPRLVILIFFLFLVIGRRLDVMALVLTACLVIRHLLARLEAVNHRQTLKLNSISLRRVRVPQLGTTLVS